MKYRFVKKAFTVVLACMLCLTAVSVFADPSTVEVDGTVVNTMEMPVTARYTGTVDRINVRDGSYVREGDVIATLKTTAVYATEDGTVRLFGSIGDSTSMVTGHYGAVAYIEPDIRFTVSANTRSAYDSEENRTVHPGESVYLRGSNTLTHVGTGTVTQVSNAGFTVDVLEGNFDADESVYVYRDEAYSNTQRIGRGTTARAEYTVYEGSGIIVAYNVTDGSKVRKGDILFETIEGEFAGYQTDLTEIRAAESGVITSLSVAPGSSISAGTTVCTLYPDEHMRVEAAVNEESLAAMPVGSAVQVHFTYVSGGEYTVSGVVEEISAAGYTDEQSESDESFYKAIVRLDDITGVSYGMTVTVVN